MVSSREAHLVQNAFHCHTSIIEPGHGQVDAHLDSGSGYKACLWTQLPHESIERFVAILCSTLLVALEQTPVGQPNVDLLQFLPYCLWQDIVVGIDITTCLLLLPSTPAVNSRRTVLVLRFTVAGCMRDAHMALDMACKSPLLFRTAMPY